jgi:hypothetical protein
MQAISGALQMAGGIILLLEVVRRTVLFRAIMLARAFALLSFGARGGWETLVCRRCCCWAVETVCANVRTKAPATTCYYCILVQRC